MNCKLALSIRLNGRQIHFPKPMGYRRRNHENVFELFSKRIVSRYASKSKYPFFHQTINRYNKRWTPIHFKILSYQNQINDIITLKLLNIQKKPKPKEY